MKQGQHVQEIDQGRCNNVQFHRRYDTKHFYWQQKTLILRHSRGKHHTTEHVY